MITREFNLYLHAGHSIPLVINANQYDHGEQWLFTLFNSDGTQYVPSSGAIVGIKSDNLGIINSGSVDGQGRVVINETQQMTAAVGKAVFELLIDDQTHGTANFIVLVEPKPGDNADLSESDLSLIQQAIDGTSATAIAQGVSDWMDENLTPTTPVVDASLTVSGAAADAKKTGDEISDLKSQISNSMPSAVKHALDAMLLNMVVKDDDVFRDEYNTFHTWAYAVNLLSISAVYTPSRTVYDTDTLDSLRSDLVVTASYDDGTSQVVTGYTLSGELTEGTSTITVAYEGETTSFNVTVESQWWTLEWDQSDGGYPYTVDSSHWTKVSATNAVSFVTGKGVRFNGSSGTFSIYPTGYETSSSSTYEIDFTINTMPTSAGVVLRCGNGTIGMQAMINSGGVSMDASTLISGVSIATGVKHTLKLTCNTAGTCKAYLNGSEIWSGSASDIGSKKNYVMMTTTSAMDAYFSRIRFAPTA